MDLKIKDVSELLNVSEGTIRRWVTDGKIPGYRLDHQYRFSRSEIESWMIHRQLKLKGEDSAAFEESIASEPGSRLGMQQYGLYRAVNQGNVFDDLPGTTKEELIGMTTQRIAPTLSVDAEVLCELLLDREQLMPTALNGGVAVPHTRDFLVPNAFDMVAIVYPQEPIAYGALDGQAVHTLFFLFGCSDKRHLFLLAKLAHLCSNEQALSFFRTKPDKKRVLEYLKQWELSTRK